MPCSFTELIPEFHFQGNLNWMRSREASLKSPVWRDRESEFVLLGIQKHLIQQILIVLQKYGLHL